MEWRPLTVVELVAALGRSPVPWWLSGGHAIDELLGFSSRPHGDIDITVARADWTALHASLTTLHAFIARDGELHDADHMPLGDADRAIWLRDRAGGPWRLQINLEPIANGVWTYARDPRIALPIADAFWTSSRLPCLRAHVQLLWKSKAPSAKDEQDYVHVIPRLEVTERAWLARSIRIAHPGSPWASR